MAIAGTNRPAGTTWTNSFSDAAVQDILFGQWGATATFSPDGRDVTLYINDRFLTIQSENGIDLPFFLGTIVGLVTPYSAISEINFSVRDFLNTILNGDTEGFNNLIWGGGDTITGGASDDTIHGFGGNDVLYGGAGKDSLFGDAGKDALFGGAGDDRLAGGAGNDRLEGGAGSDRILAGIGNDRITGGTGNDYVFGGLGADTFVFTTMAEFAAFNSSADPTVDIIADFYPSQGDLIDLRRIDANAVLAGDQAFLFIGDAAFADNTPGTVRVTALPFRYSFLVEFNTDDDAAAEATMAVTCPGPTAAGVPLVVSDFLL
jgi:Ca2+-binding RTX toxin-like protein